jgi:vacuolar-type H+-ATPase subunit H
VPLHDVGDSCNGGNTAAFSGFDVGAGVFVGVTTAVGLSLLGVPMAFTLGLLSGLLTFIPYLGPVSRYLNEREARVVEAERRAKQALHEAELLRKESEKRLEEVQEQVQGIVAQARAEAELKRVEIVAQAEREAQRPSRRWSCLESTHGAIDAVFDPLEPRRSAGPRTRSPPRGPRPRVRPRPSRSP